MDFRGPVLRRAQHARGLGAAADGGHRHRVQPGLLGGEAEGHEAADIGRNGGHIGADDGEELVAAQAGFPQLIGLHERHAALIDDQPTLGEHPGGVAVEFVGEQHFTHADRVGRVDDDGIERCIRRGAHIVDPVADDHVRPRVGPGIAADRGQEFLAQADDFAVDLHHHRAGDVAVLQHPAQHAAVASADDQHPVGIAMCEQRHMGQHFLVDELIPLGDLHHTVEQHNAAV